MSSQASADRKRNLVIFKRKKAERKKALSGMSQSEKRTFLRKEASERELNKKKKLLPKLVEGIDEPSVLASIPSRLRAALCPSTVRATLKRQ